MDRSSAMRAGIPAIDDPLASASDEAVLARIRAGHTEEFAVIMRRYNQRLFRVARAILRDANEAEDVVQHAYLSAYSHLHQFAGSAAFSTWLTRIVINEALGRTRALRRTRMLEDGESAPDWCAGAAVPNPEDTASDAELVLLLEAAIDALPDGYRTVVVLRELEGLSTLQAAECLAISEEAVRVRLHRARVLLRASLAQRLGLAGAEVFSFGGERCARTVQRVLARIALEA